MSTQSRKSKSRRDTHATEPVALSLDNNTVCFMMYICDRNHYIVCNICAKVVCLGLHAAIGLLTRHRNSRPCKQHGKRKANTEIRMSRESHLASTFHCLRVDLRSGSPQTGTSSPIAPSPQEHTPPPHFVHPPTIPLAAPFGQHPQATPPGGKRA